MACLAITAEHIVWHSENEQRVLDIWPLCCPIGDEIAEPTMRSLVPTLQSVLLATTASLHSASASVGVVDIDSLLHTKDQHPIVPASAHYDAPTPWSHPPHCVRSTSLSSAGKRFCVYSSNMTGPTGISLILTPKTAVAAQHHIDDSPLTNFLTDAQAEALYLNDPPYKVVDMQEKGMGVVAARRIEMYETIMVDQAAVVEDVDVEGAVEDGLARKLLARAVRQLRRPVIVRDLSAKHAGYQPGVEAEGEDEGRLEEDVMLTNAFGSAIAGTKCRALYPLVSVRNALFVEHGSRLMLRVRCRGLTMRVIRTRMCSFRVQASRWL